MDSNPSSEEFFTRLVNSGSPIGHLLPVRRGAATLRRRLDEEGCLIISGSDGDPPWREDEDIEDIAVFGEWSGGSPDAEWGRGEENSADEEADEADPAWL